MQIVETQGCDETQNPPTRENLIRDQELDRDLTFVRESPHHDARSHLKILQIFFLVQWINNWIWKAICFFTQPRTKEFIEVNWYVVFFLFFQKTSTRKIIFHKEIIWKSLLSSQGTRNYILPVKSLMQNHLDRPL